MITKMSAARSTWGILTTSEPKLQRNAALTTDHLNRRSRDYSPNAQYQIATANLDVQQRSPPAPATLTPSMG